MPPGGQHTCLRELRGYQLPSRASRLVSTPIFARGVSMLFRSFFAIAILPATMALAQPAGNLRQLKEAVAKAQPSDQVSLENRITTLFPKKDLEAGTAKPKLDGLT